MPTQQVPGQQHSGDVIEMMAAQQSEAKEPGVAVEGQEIDSEWKSTSADADNMRRMGKSQQLVRHFRIFSMASFVAVALGAWVFPIFNLTVALANGGPPVLLYSHLWNTVGFAPIYLSMAEMASMAPIAGAQYHWVSEFAPERLQRGLSYLTGWTSTLAWQAGNAQGLFLAGQIIQIIISLHDETYTFPRWQTTLLTIAVICVAYVGDVYGYRVLHLWQNAIFALQIMVYFAFFVPIWVNAPRATSSQVWSEFTFSGGWPNAGLAVLVGQQTGIFSQIGFDTAAHMSEEVRDASNAVPKVVLTIWFLVFCLTFPAFVTISYHIPSLSDALADPTLFPIMYVLRQSMSTPWLTLILTILLLLIVCSNMSYLAAVSRDIWAFARDQGFPFSDWISRVDDKRRIPKNAIIVTSFISFCLSFIYIGNSAAFYAVTSLVTVSLLQCYCLSIGCLLWRKIKYPETLPPARFSLGRLGIPINIAAVIYAFWAFFWTFWPTFTPVVPLTFNWAPVLFVAALVGAGVHFIFVGRHKYFGPVVNIEKRNVGSSVKVEHSA
jgi:amino acid transporter